MSWEDSLPAIEALVAVGVIVLAGFLISRLVAGYLRKRGAPPHAVRGARISISIVAALGAFFVLYAAFGAPPEVSGLTVSAVLLLAATVGLQSTIANIIAGLILMRNRVLWINDTVQISGISGRVVQLGPVTTWLRLDDGSVASISNSTLLNGPLLNRSAGKRLEGEY